MRTDFDFKYYRIQGKEHAANTRTVKGIFSMLHQMVSDGKMEQEDADLFLEIDSLSIRTFEKILIILGDKFKISQGISTIVEVFETVH